MKYHTLLLLTGLLLGTAALPALGQADNRYCTSSNTWVGTTSAAPVLYDGPAALPTACLNTDPANMPSPGPVVSVPSGQSLSAAYAAAACGTTLLLAHGGVWTDPYSFPSKNCDDQHWITIASDGVLPPVGVRIGPDYTPQTPNLQFTHTAGVATWGDHIHFVGINFTKNSTNILFQFMLMRGASKVVFDRCLFRGTPGQEVAHGIQLSSGQYVALIDSYIDELHCLAGTGTCVESQAVSGGAGDDTIDVTSSGPIKVVNNFLEASTQGILFGGDGANGPGPNNAEIRRNYMFRPMSWNPADPSYTGIKYVVKNCFELKNGTHVLFEGNVCENVWGGFTQAGSAILLTPKNQAGAVAGTNLCPLCAVNDIVLRYNHVSTASSAITIASGVNNNGAYSAGEHRLSIHDNIFDNLQYGATCYNCSFQLLQIGSSYSSTSPPPPSEILSDVSFVNNDVIAVGVNPSTALHQVSGLATVTGPPAVNVSSTPQITNFVFQNNIVSTQTNGLYSPGGGADNCATVTPFKSYKIWPACMAGNSAFSGNVLVGYPAPATDWPAGNYFVTDWATGIGFDDYANGVYLLPQSSPYYGKGPNVDLVNAMTFGVR